MSFLSLIAVFLIEQLQPLNYRRVVEDPLVAWAEFIESRFNAGEYRQGVIAWCLAVLLPVLLVAGLGGRLAALGLSVVNIVAVISLSDIAPAALQQHVTWGVLLAALAIFGVGRWSLDHALVNPWLRRATGTPAA